MIRAQGFARQAPTAETAVNASISVFNSGTMVLATIYADNLLTAKPNPFTADANGYWFFYALSGRYDVTVAPGVSQPTFTQYTQGDVDLTGFFSLNGLTNETLTLVANPGAGTTDFTISTSGGNQINFNIPDASATARGFVNTGAQTFNGPKTFNTPIAIGSGGTGLSTAPTNGQLLIGNAGAYSLATLTGTANQVSIANGAGSITISLPQNIHTGATPQFAGLTLTGGLTGTSMTLSGTATVNSLVDSALSGNQFGLPYISTTGGGLAPTAPLTNGQVLIGSTGSAPVPALITAGTNITVTPGAGTLTIASSGLTTAQAQALLMGTVNCVANDTFLFWSLGDSSAPDHFTLTGSGATIARVGTGLSDTHQKVGKYAAKVTFGSATAQLVQNLIPTTSFSNAGGIFGGVTVAFGCWVWASVANQSRVWFDDGILQTQTAFHPGDSAWHFLAATAVVSASATKMQIYPTVESSGSAYFSGLTWLLSPIAPTNWTPCPKIYGTLHFPLTGAISVGTKQGMFLAARPMMVKDVQVRLDTAPTGTSAIFDLKTWDGAAFTSMFTSGNRPTIAISGNFGESQPDGVAGANAAGAYMRKFIQPAFVSSGTADPTGELEMEVVQVGSGVSGSNLTMEVRCLQYLRILEDFLGFSDL